MNSEPVETPEEEEFEHVHRWSLLKDREFYELGDLISRYFVGVQGNNDCPHTDSPLVDSVETIAAVLWRAASLPDHPGLRAVFMEMMQAVGLLTFSAGMRFAADGHELDGTQKFMTCEVPEQDKEHAWGGDALAEGIREWRENRIQESYNQTPAPEMTDEQRKMLEELTGQKIPKGARVLFGGPEGSVAIGVPRQNNGGGMQPLGDNPTGYL